MSYGPVVPTLRVATMAESLAFYRDVLGFATKWMWSEEAGFGAAVPSLVCIEHGEAMLFLSDNDGGRAGSHFIELAFVQDVDRLAATLGDRVQYQGPVNRPWGSRELSLKDPDGHSFRFSCPVERGNGD